MQSVRWSLLNLCLFLTSVTKSICALEDGDECTLVDGKKGICKNIKNCTDATTILKAGRKPKVCGFDGLDPIVCCPNKFYGFVPINEKLRTSDLKCRQFYPYPIVPVILELGAKRAVAEEFRHMALVGYGHQENDIRWLCGGSLVSLQFVLTAAHCLYAGQNDPAKWVRLGELDISTNTDGTEYQQIRVKKIIPHPEYRSPFKYHDIALLELDTPAKWTKFVAPACLDSKRTHNETKMIATGWGRTSFSGDFSNHLLKTDLDVIPVDQCRESFKNDRSELPNLIDDELQICAGGGPKYDTCEGDSGGPLQVISKNKTLVTVYVVVGVTSFGKACGISPSPGVYTRVHSHLSWLEQNIWPSG